MLFKIKFSQFYLFLILAFAFTRFDALHGIQVSEFTFDIDAPKETIIFRCLHKLTGNEKLETFRLRLNGSEFYSYAPYAYVNYQKQAQFWVDGVSVDIENSNGTHVLLNNVRNRIKGIFTCKISSQMGRSVSEEHHNFVIGIDVPNGNEQIARQNPTQSVLAKNVTNDATYQNAHHHTRAHTHLPLTTPASYQHTTGTPSPAYSRIFPIHSPRNQRTKDSENEIDSQRAVQRSASSTVASEHLAANDVQTDTVSKLINPEYLSHFTRLNLLKMYAEINELREQSVNLNKAVRSITDHVRQMKLHYPVFNKN